MKTIRIQIDMVYQVLDDKAEDTYNHDIGFFHAIKEDFDRWESKESEHRMPVKFDLRHDMIRTVVEDEEE